MARGPGVTDPEPRLAAGVALHPHTRTSERQDRARAEEPGSQELRAGSSRFGSSPRPPLPADCRREAPMPRGASVCLSSSPPRSPLLPGPPLPLTNRGPSGQRRLLEPKAPRTRPSPRACGPRLLPACPTLLATLAASLPR